MRTTVEIEDDVLQAARELASNRNLSLGRVLSELLRKGLEGPGTGTASVRNGVPVLPRRRRGAARPTMELVNRLRDAG